VAEVEKVADSDVIFLQNHGVITYGPDIYEAFSRMDAVENTAKTILYSQILGDVREF
jgi:class II aldolase and adducin N-terminal domain